MGRFLVALAILLALTGCVQVTHPPATGLSAEAREAYAERAMDSYWGEPEMQGLRPASIEVTFVDSANWGNVVVECITDAGYDGYESVGGGGISFAGEQTLDERYALLLCVSEWQVEPEQTGVLNDAQLNYLYDYYRDITVPCMALAGLPVVEAQTRAEFIETGGYWRPYSASDTVSSFDIGKSAWYRSAPDNDLEALCPTWPTEWGLENLRG